MNALGYTKKMYLHQERFEKRKAGFDALYYHLQSEDSTRHIPVIMLTGRADQGSKLKALRIGVDDYLIKPYDEDELLVRIENLLKNQAARQLESQTEAEPTRSIPALSKEGLDWLTAFEDYIRNHLNDDTLSVPTLARNLSCKVQFDGKCLQFDGFSPSE